MKKILISLAFLLLFAACKSGKIDENSYLEYKDLYCNHFIGSKFDIGILERNSNAIITTEQNKYYKEYIVGLQNINFPAKYRESISQTISLLNQKTELGEKFKVANEKFEVKHPNVSLFFSCKDLGLIDNCVDATEKSLEFHKSLYDPIEEELRTINAKLLLEHDKVFILAKEDLEIIGQQYMCGKSEPETRVIFENY